MPLHHSQRRGPVLQAEQTGLAQSVFLGMGCQPKVFLATPLFLFTSGICVLQWWANTCMWWVELSYHNHVLYLCYLCVLFFVLPTFAINCNALFIWFLELKEKTNKHMSSVSFIVGQPVINASAVVSLRRCRLICLSLSKTCLCGPYDR